MTMLVTLIRDGRRLDWASCHSGELALDLACIMLRRHHRLEVGDRIVVETMPDWQPAFHEVLAGEARQ